MLRIILFILLITACIENGLAQSQSVPAVIQSDISGVVREIHDDDSIAVAVPNANIRLLNAGDSSLVKGMLSDSNGRFLFADIKQGDYLLAVSFLGYATSFTQIPATKFRRNDKIDIGVIILKETEIQLDEVIVEGQIPELVIRGDTMEYNPAAFQDEGRGGSRGLAETAARIGSGQERQDNNDKPKSDKQGFSQWKRFF